MEDLVPKMILCGNSTVGKTTLLQALRGEPCGSTETTIPVGFVPVSLGRDKGAPQLFSAWDTAGQESYRSLVHLYFRGGNIALIVFDVCSRESFEALDGWIIEVEENCGRQCKIILVGNKIDLSEARIISSDEIMNLAKTLNTEFIEVSAKTGENVELLSDLILGAWKIMSAEKRRMSSVGILQAMEAEEVKPLPRRKSKCC
jgi:small GTP-binding protein